MKKKGSRKKSSGSPTTTKSVTRFFLEEGAEVTKTQSLLTKTLLLSIWIFHCYIDLFLVLGMGRVSFSGLGFGFLDTFSWVKSFPFDSQFWLDLAKRHFLHQLFGLGKKNYHI